MTILSDSLLSRVPNQASLREQKKGYKNTPIDKRAPLYNEPLVDISAHGVAGQAYYSRPNAVTKRAIIEVPKTLFLRESIVKTLAQLNNLLEQSEITDFFNGDVELYVEDALRPVSLQAQLHDDILPRLLKDRYPDMGERELLNRIEDIIAIPSRDPEHPSPHATGGAFDITLRYKQQDRSYVAGSAIEMGHYDGEVSERINPDYFEYTSPKNESELLARRNRRAFYAIMTGAAFNTPTGFVNNPTEWWHWGRGDQLSARLQGNNKAYYSLMDKE